MDDLIRMPFRPNEIFTCMSRYLGVSFVYRNAQPESDAKVFAELTSEKLAALPEALRQELIAAVIELNETRFEAQDAELGKALKHHADNLE